MQTGRTALGWVDHNIPMPQPVTPCPGGPQHGALKAVQSCASDTNTSSGVRLLSNSPQKHREQGIYRKRASNAHTPSD